MIAPIDEDDLHRRVRQRLGRRQAAEPAADDDDLRPRRGSPQYKRVPSPIRLASIVTKNITSHAMTQTITARRVSS